MDRDAKLARDLLNLAPLKAASGAYDSTAIAPYDLEAGPPITLDGKYARLVEGDLEAWNGDRSSALFALTGHLLRGGVPPNITVDYVSTIDSAAGIGKFVGRPDQYWKMVENVQLPDVLEAPAPLNPGDYLAGGRRYYKQGGSYWAEFQTKDGAATVELSNFVFDNPRLVRLGEETWLKTDVVMRTHQVRRDFQIPSANFKSRLPDLGGGMWLGSDTDLGHILRWTTQSAPVFAGVSSVGRHGPLFVTSSQVYDKDGPNDGTNTVYVQRGSAPPSVTYAPELPPLDMERRRSIGQFMLGLNEPRVMVPVLGWLFASLFAPLIREKVKHFPILTLYGSPSAGKTSVLNILTRYLYGDWTEALKPSTAFATLSTLGSVNALPLVWDEVYRSDSHGRILLDHVKELYSGEVARRGTQSLTVREFPLVAPTVLLGEIDQRGTETSYSDRTIAVYLPAADTRTDEQRASYRRLRDQSAEMVSRFATDLMYYSLRTNFDDVWTEATQFEVEAQKDREIDNAHVIGLGWLSFMRFTGEHLEGDATTIIKNLYVGDSQLTGRIRPPLLTFVEQLAVLAQLGQLQPGIDYEIKDGELRIRRGSAWKLYSERYRDDVERVKATSHTLGLWLGENPGDVVLDPGKVFQFTQAGSSRGFALSIDRLVEAGVSIEGFRE